MEQLNCTHEKETTSFDELVLRIKNRIFLRKDLSVDLIAKQIDIIQQLSEFPLGRFFIERRGANGYWSDYIINHEEYQKNGSKEPCNSIENFILNKCPLTMATKERFKIFQNELQKHLKEGMTLASIPCGLMRDLLSLDYSCLSEFSILGVDSDPESIVLARNLSFEYGLEKHANFIQGDAWKLNLFSEIDLLTSNGLNVYVPDKMQLLDLYKVFYGALKKNGILIIGVLTPPPGHSDYIGWNLDLLSSEDIETESILYQDILGCKWRNFSTPNDVYRDFSSVGFRDIQIIFDKYRIFPTVIARK